MSKRNRRRVGHIWHDVRCMEEHLRALQLIVCAIGAQKGIEDVETGTSDEDREEVEGGLEKGSIFGPADGGTPCVPGYPCDGGGREIGSYLDWLERYCEIVMEEIRALVGTLDAKDRIHLCGGMLCACPRKHKGHEH